MRHATPSALDQLAPLLVRLRVLPGLVEKNRGVFHRRGRAFLHFHQDPSGLHADVRLGEDFERVCVESVEQRNDLFDRIEASCSVGG